MRPPSLSSTSISFCPRRHCLTSLILLLSLSFFVSVAFADALSHLRVNEVMFSCQDASYQEKSDGFLEADLFAYIEIVNISPSETLSLDGVSVGGSVQYAFASGVTLAPSELLVIVANTGAFNHRYGSVGAQVLGPWTGRFVSGGNTVSLSVSTQLILNLNLFDWYPELIGEDRGFSLVVNGHLQSPGGPPIAVTEYDQQSRWHLSQHLGSPGSVGAGGASIRFTPASKDILFSGSVPVTMTVVGLDPSLTATIVFSTNRMDPSATTGTQYENFGYCEPDGFEQAGWCVDDRISPCPIDFISGECPGGANIRCCITPQTPSTAYDSANPPVFSQSTLIRARAVMSNGSLGPTLSKIVIAESTSLSSFVVTPGVPAVIVEAFGQEVDVGDKFWRDVALLFIQPPDGVSTLSNSHVTLVTPARMKVRGSSSSTNEKKQFSVEFYDDDFKTENHKPLGLPKESDFVFFATQKWDRVQVRNAFAYTVSRELMGHYAPRTKFFEMFLVKDSMPVDVSSHFWGFYVLTEKIKRDHSRVNIAQTFPTTPPRDAGFIIKQDRQDPDVNDSFQTDASKFIYVYPKVHQINPSQTLYLQNWWKDWWGLVRTTPDKNTLVSPWMDYIELKETIDYHILTIYTKNPDSLVLSTYLYKQADGPLGEIGKFTFGPCWDYDRAMNCDDDGTPTTPYQDRSTNPVGHGFMTGTHFNGMWGHMFNDQQWLRRYSNRYHELRSGIFKPELLSTLVHDIGGVVAPAAPRNYERWGFEPPSGTFAGGLEQISSWSNLRVAWMDQTLCYGPGNEPPCKDTDYCTDDVCSIQDGQCYNVPNECPFPECRQESSDGDPCGSGSFCNPAGSCLRGDCVFGSPPDCDDGISCTIDTCENDACAHTPVHTDCDDGFICSTNTCNPSLGCEFVGDDLECDDEISCTVNRCEEGVGCSFVPIDGICDDGDGCTRDTCDPSLDCQNIFDDSLFTCQSPSSPTTSPTTSSSSPTPSPPTISPSTTFSSPTPTLNPTPTPTPTVTQCTNQSAATACTLHGYHCVLSFGRCDECPTGSSPDATRTLCLSDSNSLCSTDASICTSITSTTSSSSSPSYCDLIHDRCVLCGGGTVAHSASSSSGCVDPASLNVESSFPLPMVIGIIAGAIVLLVIIGGLVYYFLIYRPGHSNSYELGAMSTGSYTGMQTSLIGGESLSVSQPSQGGRVYM